jgi:ubiquinone/menaquinone biosynthesis C-methylase UbiE
MDEVKKTIEVYEEILPEFLEHNKKFDMIKEMDSFQKYLPGKKILDVGCGPGRDVEAFCKRGFDVTGIDLTLSFVEMAQKRVPEAKVIQMDMRHLEFPDESFDGIWSLASLIHIPKKDIKKTLEGFYRVLEKKGVIFLAVKEGEGEKWVEKFGKDRFYAFYQEKEILDLLESVGFKIIESVGKKVGYDWIKVLAVKN